MLDPVGHCISDSADRKTSKGMPDQRRGAGDTIGVIDEQLVASAPLRRADEQVAQGFDEGSAEHGMKWGQDVGNELTTSLRMKRRNPASGRAVDFFDACAPRRDGAKPFPE